MVDVVIYGASYQIAVKTAQNLVTTAQNITDPGGDLTGGIGRAVLASLHGPRRPRVCARKVKSPLSCWNKIRDLVLRPAAENPAGVILQCTFRRPRVYPRRKGCVSRHGPRRHGGPPVRCNPRDWP